MAADAVDRRRPGRRKTTLSWHLSRAHDLPLHRIDLWTYEHQERMPAGDSLDEQLARGPEAAADVFEAHSRLRLGCECAESGCHATWTATPDDYAARTASGRRLIAHDRDGPVQ